MALVERIDPEARTALDAWRTANEGLWAPDLSERRARFDAMARPVMQDAPVRARVHQRDVTIAGPDGDPLRLQLTRPATASGTLPAVLCLHGGGFVIGSVETDQAQVLPLADELGALVVSVDYRLAPEHPHPAPVEDCHAALAWMVAQADELDIDPQRIALFGTSAGGGLAAGVALMARDRATATPALQVLGYPMLDDRGTTVSSRQSEDLGAWDRELNFEGWRHLLGDRAGGAEVDGYAAPARATRLAGVCPAYVDVGELDLLRDECVAYAARLMEAGVPTELHVFRGAYHACEQIAAETPLGQRIRSLRTDALRQALAVSG